MKGEISGSNTPNILIIYQIGQIALWSNGIYGLDGLHGLYMVYLIIYIYIYIPIYGLYKRDILTIDHITIDPSTNPGKKHPPVVW